jgi:hypothetical protein
MKINPSDQHTSLALGGVCLKVSSPCDLHQNRCSNNKHYITKIESGLLKLNKERFNLKQVIFNTVDDYRNQIKVAIALV